MSAIDGNAVDPQGAMFDRQGDMAESPVAIAVEHIFKRYGDFEAVKDVSFNVVEGEIFGLLGPNGAGKSTLIRMMTTLIPITAGKAFINGYDVESDPDAARRSMGVIPQAICKDAIGGEVDGEQRGTREEPAEVEPVGNLPLIA